MKLPERFQTLSSENKKIILYKVAEIYWWDDKLLNFIDSLEGDDIDVVCNIIFAENENEREILRKNELANLEKTVEEIEFLNNNIDKLAIEISEFSEKINEETDIENIEDFLENITN